MVDIKLILKKNYEIKREIGSNTERALAFDPAPQSTTAKYRRKVPPQSTATKYRHKAATLIN